MYALRVTTYGEVRDGMPPLYCRHPNRPRPPPPPSFTFSSHAPACAARHKDGANLGRTLLRVSPGKHSEPGNVQCSCYPKHARVRNHIRIKWRSSQLRIRGRHCQQQKEIQSVQLKRQQKNSLPRARHTATAADDERAGRRIRTARRHRSCGCCVRLLQFPALF